MGSKQKTISHPILFADFQSLVDEAGPVNARFALNALGRVVSL